MASAISTDEVNEAFASVPLAWARELDADPAKLNPWGGGAIALGHAVDASGTRLLGTLFAHLEATGRRPGESPTTCLPSRARGVSLENDTFSKG